MATIKAVAAILAVAFALVADASAFHRVADAHITIDRSEIAGQPVAAFTVRLDAEDALRMVEGAYPFEADVTDPALLEFLAEKVASRIVLDQGDVVPLGGEVDGEFVYVFLYSDAAAEVMTSSIFSTVYLQWTNFLEDKRSDGPTRMFTQQGELAPGEPLPQHHHHH